MKKLIEKKFEKIIFETYDGKPDFILSKVKQVHGNCVVNINLSHDDSIEADGQIAPLPLAEPMAVITADCLPILLIGEREVAFVHAGWRGLKNEIVFDEKIKKMNPKKAYIGPHINKCCFEVQPDFKNHFPEDKYYEQRDGKTYFDLSLLAKDQLSQFASLGEIEVEKSCTCCTKEFKSFRRNGTMDRNWNIIKNR